MKARRERVDKQKKYVSSFDIPLKKAKGIECVDLIEMPRRIVKMTSPVVNFDGTVNVGIAEQDYKDILKVIRFAGSSFERTPKTYGVFCEEGLRDIVVSHLNVVFEGEAKAEVFNKKGKTDILISRDGRSAFVAECKIWGGDKALSNAMSQLLGYLTWRDCKAAIVCFNKSIKNFRNLLNKVDSILEAHDRFSRLVLKEGQNEWVFELKSESDDSNIVRVHLFIFDMYCPEGECTPVTPLSLPTSPTPSP